MSFRLPVGVRGTPALAWLEPDGSLTLTGPQQTVQLRVWVGVEDRWREPASEASTRQRLLGPAPVRELALRVPGGDVTWRVFGALGATGPCVVIEAANASRVPVSFAVAVAAPRGNVSATEGWLCVDGQVLLGAARQPGAVWAGGERSGPPVGPTELPGGLATAAGVAVWPLPHGTTLQVGVPLGGHVGVASGRFPSSDSVVRGWAQQLGSGATFDVGDDAMLATVGAARGAALLMAPSADAPAVARLLDLWGHHDEAANVLARAGEVGTAHAGELLAALGLHWRLTRDRAFADTVTEAVGAALVGGGVASLDAGGRDDVVELLEAGGQPAAAARLRGEALGARPRWRRRRVAEPAVGDQEELWAVAEQVRHRLVTDNGPGEVALATGDGSIEWGSTMEGLRMPSACGPVSFAVRWHGRRPALLWEVDTGVAGDRLSLLRLSAPTLDPTWSSDQPRGEALLAEPANLPAPPSAPSFS